MTHMSTSMTALPDPLPVDVVHPGGGAWFGVAVATERIVAWDEDGPPHAVMEQVLVIAANGYALWVNKEHVTFKFPPNGPYRLLMGWAEKGQS